MSEYKHEAMCEPCDMRAYFAFITVPLKTSSPPPASMVDFVINFEGPRNASGKQTTVLAFKFCPWCGLRIKPETERIFSGIG